MFSKSKKGNAASDADQALPAKVAAPSIISADLKIVGDLHSDGEIQVDGAVEGDIRTRDLLIGKEANVKGEIIAESIIIHGSINGQMKARSVRLANTAHVVGDIVHQDLAIEKGAFLEGHCKRYVDKPEPAKLPVAQKDDKSKVASGGAADAAVDKGKGGDGKKTVAA